MFTNYNDNYETALVLYEASLLLQDNIFFLLSVQRALILTIDLFFTNNKKNVFKVLSKTKHKFV